MRGINPRRERMWMCLANPSDCRATATSTLVRPEPISRTLPFLGTLSNAAADHGDGKYRPLSGDELSGDKLFCDNPGIFRSAGGKLPTASTTAFVNSVLPSLQCTVT